MNIDVENKDKARYEFINVLKVLAAILITNSHYTNIWPYSFMAFGGLLGDVLYFAISGFCLADIKGSFSRWYLKRILRIYPILWIVNIIGASLGYFEISSIKAFMKLFIYPTYFHFIASIMMLYIIFYFIVKYLLGKIGFKAVMVCLTVLYVAIYLLLYDKSYYHIDVVEEDMVRFLFLASMLLGVYFRKYSVNEKKGFLQYIQVFGLFLMYLISKVAFSKINTISIFQILNVVLIYALLYSIFKV
ncbi:MAG: acyltransferase family protein, partial [Intestinibacter sp.]